MKKGDLLAVHCHPENVAYQWFRESPIEVEVPAELKANELVTYTGESAISGSIGYLRIISRHGVGWVSMDYLKVVPP